MFDDVHLLRLNAHKSLLGTAWLSRKRLRGARCTLRSWQKRLKSFRSNFHLYLHRKKKSNTNCKYNFATKSAIKKRVGFFSIKFNQQNPTISNQQKIPQNFWDPFLLNLFDRQVTTMDLCNLGTDAASTLAVKVES